MSNTRLDAPTNVETVVFALFELTEGMGAVHLERIAVRAFELTPGAFRWDLDDFAGSVDKDKVRVSLTDAQKEAHGLVKAVGPKRAGLSKPTDLWVLTPAGVVWITENRDRLAGALGVQAPSLKKGRVRVVRDRLVSSELYEEFSHVGSLTYNPYSFADLIECSPDASTQVMEQRFQALRAQVLLLNDPHLERFLMECGRVHGDMVDSESGGQNS